MTTRPLWAARSPVLPSCLRGLISAMFARDPHTAAHQERVGILARRLARRLGLDHDHAERVALAGRVHDIGKLGVSLSLLASSAPLGPTERRVMQSHARCGAQMLESIGVRPEVCEAVRSHHERLDGRGYPAGLSDVQITLDARILAVADVIDAMLSDRPYRGRCTSEEVEAVLRAERSRAYDPRVVDAALLELGRLEDEGGPDQPLIPAACASC